MNDGNKIYFKGESYGGEPEEVKYFAVEGDPSFEEGETEYELTKEEVTPLSGDSYLRVNIPMGTVVDTATVSGEEIETHIKQISHETEIEANIGSRMKFGAIPQEGIIAGGLRIAKGGTNGVFGTTNAASEEAKANLENYIYSDIPQSDKIWWFAFSSTGALNLTDETCERIVNCIPGEAKINASLSVSYILDSSSRLKVKRPMNHSSTRVSGIWCPKFNCIPIQNVPQLTTLPTPGPSYLNQICQFIGNTSTVASNPIPGHFYKCKYNEEDPENPYYYWELDNTYEGQYEIAWSSSQDGYTNYYPINYGYIFLLQKYFTSETTGKSYCLCSTYIVNRYDDSGTIMKFATGVSTTDSSRKYLWILIEMSEAEARYNYGVEDVYHQMNYEDWRQLEGEEIVETPEEEEENSSNEEDSNQNRSINDAPPVDGGNNEENDAPPADEENDDNSR